MILEEVQKHPEKIVTPHQEVNESDKSEIKKILLKILRKESLL